MNYISSASDKVYILLRQSLRAILLTAAALVSLSGLFSQVVLAESGDATVGSFEEKIAPFDELLTVDGALLEESPAVGNGRWKLVMIWATDCPICKQQKPVISAFHDAHKDKDAEVFGIALDGRQGLVAVNKYLQKHTVSFPNYVGEFSTVAVNYQELTEEDLRGTPTYLLFNPEGELKGNNPGPISVDAIEAFIARHSS
ncbi:MAG: TlpA disulfide reductase family protein [Granulosicoccus sp.]